MSYSLYFGDESIVLTWSRPGINGTYITKGRVSAPYNGIIEGDFASFVEIPGVMKNLMNKANFPNTHRNKLLVGVPSCFCVASSEYRKREFEKPTKVNKKIVAELLGGGEACYFKVDGGPPLITAIGRSCMKIEVLVSNVKIKTTFVDAIRQSFCISRGFKGIKYMPVPLAEARYLINVADRDKTAYLISYKMADTSVSVIVGDHLCTIDTLDMGYAHVINDISMVKNIDFKSAAMLLKRYNAQDSDGIMQIVDARLEDMAEQIKDILLKHDPDLLTRRGFMCGGHTDEIYGAHQIFSQTIGAELTVLKCPLNEDNIPDATARDGLAIASL
ncbi:MAG: hypothetical protein FWC00_03705 [Firmicutes bacterium]|nr:hypothetical protein [Bacillota bacterium]